MIRVLLVLFCCGGVLGQQGDLCAGCTIVLSFLERVSKFREISIEETLEYICDILPTKYKAECVRFVDSFGKTVVEVLALFPPDYACQEIQFCKNPKCLLFADENSPPPVRRKGSSRLGDEHLPTFDSDKDAFSTFFTMRGTAWRGWYMDELVVLTVPIGKDCSDDDPEIYPGRKKGGKFNLDYNCNGIYPKDGVDYQKEFCSGPNSGRGLVVLGDSSAARFRIPPQLIASNVTVQDWESLTEIFENEFDWPHLGMYAGHLTDDTGLTPGKVESVYLHMLGLNRCNHRDYQNMGENGAKTVDIEPLARGMHRDPDNDLPVTLFINLLANDVCYTSPHTFTPIEKFREGVVTGLKVLGSKLPNGSHVFVFGLIDGRMIAEAMLDHIHPVGVTFSRVYDYLICLGVSPCYGYLNKNGSARNETYEYAKRLNVVYQEEVEKERKERKYKNFEVFFLDLDFHLIQQRMIKQGIKPSQMIEPFDGFHPSQITNVFMARRIIELVQEVAPEAFGNVNPNNEKIHQIFGDQGGY